CALVPDRDGLPAPDDDDSRFDCPLRRTEGVSVARVHRGVQPAWRPGAPISLAGMELARVSTRESLANGGICAPPLPGTVPAHRPRGILRRRGVSRWRGRPLPRDTAHTAGTSGAVIMEMASRPRFRFQYSLSTLFALTAVVALLLVPVVWVARERRRVLEAR